MCKTYNSLFTFLLCFLVFESHASNFEILNSISLLQSGTIPNEEILVIPFSKKFSYTLNENVNWEIVDENSNEIIGKGTGSINEFKFVQPGNFQLNITDFSIHEPNECNHAHYPGQIAIVVSEMEMIFDFNTIQFSQELVGGQELNNLEISIEVEFKHFENKSIEFSKSAIASGVDANITGSLKPGFTLNPGKNKLVYKLSGSAAKDTYIMIDFIDNNDQRQSYYHPTKLK